MPHTCTSATFISLIFTDQKNWVKVESVFHRTTGHPRESVVVAIHFRVVYLWCQGATVQTALASVFQKKKWMLVCSIEITQSLCTTEHIAGPQVGSTPKEVGNRSMRTVCAMELLVARVDTNTIGLVGGGDIATP